MDKDPAFILECPNDGTPRPRYIGHSNDPQTAVLIKKAIPSDSYRPSNEPPASKMPSDESLEAFKEKMEDILETDKKRKLAAKLKRQAERHAKQQGWNHVTKRIQRYLGLREAAKGSPDEFFVEMGDISTNGAELGNLQAGLAKLNIKRQVDLNKPVPYPQESSVVFISVDIEAYEKNHKLITEIGIATLDTADITNIFPGEGGRNWFSKIRARHFRIKEHGHLNNTEYLQGCADGFKFG